MVIGNKLAEGNCGNSWIQEASDERTGKEEREQGRKCSNLKVRGLSEVELGKDGG